MTKQAEAAAQIEVSIEDEIISVHDLDTTTEIDIERHYGSGQLDPDLYSIKSIKHDGSIMLKGNKLALTQKLYDDTGSPKEGTITITHMDSSTTEYTKVLIVGEGFQFSEGETAETSFEWICMGRQHGTPAE